ncbi:ThiF family adenylyltransferase [Micromonospora sp. STR1s_5]|nr:ThiF family adenylyltransferase [Micromonospora sp. STR1s_5]
MNNRRDAFYAERDRRTRQYGGHDTALEQPVGIIVGDDVATTPAGQQATLALINLAARVHRHIDVRIPATRLLVPTLAPANDLHAAAVTTALAINPVLELTTSATLAPTDVSLAIGLGRDVPKGLDLYLDWAGGRGHINTAPIAGSPDPVSVFGAATAAVLGAAGLFRLVHAQPVRATRFNPIELTADDRAGTDDRSGRIDVGTVLVIGAGAVASALAYWARQLGTDGTGWDIVDADIVELHNINRCMTMTAAHAGWPDGTPTQTPAHKADATAWAVGGTPHHQWYDQWQPQHDAQRHDVVLTLANGRGVRALAAQRGEPILLHATTSASWTAELHRHVPDRDDCPACRLPDTSTPKMACATGPTIPTEPDSPDAALPFLSAAAGLMLAATLTDIPSAAALHGRFNHWQLDLTLDAPPLQPRQHPPRDGCTHQLPAPLRQAVHAVQACRWDHLDRVNQRGDANGGS